MEPISTYKNRDAVFTMKSAKNILKNGYMCERMCYNTKNTTHKYFKSISKIYYPFYSTDNTGFTDSRIVPIILAKRYNLHLPWWDESTYRCETKCQSNLYGLSKKVKSLRFRNYARKRTTKSLFQIKELNTNTNGSVKI